VSYRWLEDFDGSVVFGSVTPERLESIAAQHDLTLVAAGKSDLCNLFERDATRSPYAAPQRNLTMVIATGRMSVEGCPFLPVKFEFLGTDGEIFFVPYLHKDAGPSWNVVIEAKPGSRMDRFGGVKSGEEALAIAKNVVNELFPWSGAWLRGMQLADPLGWLTGRIAPTVRKPVATLPSGRIVAALGDTAIAFDPIAAQGANTGVKQARGLVEAIASRGDAPYDAAFLTRTFDAFWYEHARWACAFNNLFLEPISAPAKELLIAQTGSQAIADAFFANFNDPRRYTRAFLEMREARKLIREKTGRSWVYSAVTGRARVGAGRG